MRILGPSVTSFRDLMKPIQSAPLASAAGMVWASTLCVVLFFLSDPSGYDKPSIYWQHLAALISVVAFVLTFHTLRPPPIPWAALAFVGFGAFTAFWSPEPHVTLFFAARLVALTLLAAYVAAALEFRAQLAAVAGSGVVVAVTTAIEFAKGNPDVVVSEWWPSGPILGIQGIQGNRNILAFTLALALWALVARFPEGMLTRALWIAAFGTIVGGIYIAGSATGLAAVAGLGMVGAVLKLMDAPVFKGPMRRRAWLMATGAIGLTLAGGAAAYASMGRSLTRDLQFSGRVGVWQRILDVTEGRDLWLGHGWGTVWRYPWLQRPPETDLYNRIIRPGPGGVDYYVVHGHNSLLDPLPEIGLVGVALLLGGFVWVTVKAIRMHGSDTDPGHKLVARASLLGLTVLAITGVTEPMSVHPMSALVFALIAANVVASGPKARTHARDSSESVEKRVK